MMCIVGGVGISSSKFGFSPMSVSGYAMLPAKIVISVADWFSSLFSRIKAFANLILRKEFYYAL